MLRAFFPGDSLDLGHHEILQQVKPAGHLGFVADYDLSDEGSVAEVSDSLQELVDDPVSHLCVVGGYRNEGRLYQVGPDVDQGGQQVEALLDFLDGLLLVCDDLQNA